MKSRALSHQLLCLGIATLVCISTKGDLTAGPLEKTELPSPSSQTRPLTLLKRISHNKFVPAVKQVVASKPLYYDQPTHSYNLWRKPDEARWTAAERCEPRPFCPRGYGDLGNKRGGSYRMDYHRYVIRDLKTSHGPSYYIRSMEPERCCELNGDGCGCSACRKKKLFTLFP